MAHIKAGTVGMYGQVLEALVAGCLSKTKHQPTFIKIFLGQFNALFGFGPKVGNMFVFGGGDSADDQAPQLPPEALSQIPVELRLQYLAALDALHEATGAIIDVTPEQVGVVAGAPMYRGVSLIPSQDEE